MPIKPKDLVSKLQKLGFEIIRSSGSHLIMHHAYGRQTYFAIHTKDLPEGTYKSILKQAKLTKLEIDNA